MTNRTSHSYLVVAIDYGKRGIEAVVQPEITRREVIARIKSGDYRDIAFIHSIADGLAEDCTSELIDQAELELKDEYRAARSLQPEAV